MGAPSSQSGVQGVEAAAHEKNPKLNGISGLWTASVGKDLPEESKRRAVFTSLRTRPRGSGFNL